MVKDIIEVKSIGENGDEIYWPKSQKESLETAHAQIYFEALRKVILDALIPVVEAAKKDTTPKKPPPMKYKDLSVYESPHYDYKEYLNEKERCPNINVKILQTYLYPKVKEYRTKISGSYNDMKKEFKAIKNEFCEAMCKKTREFKRYMRDPQNEQLRKGVVAFGTLAGLYVGSGSRNLYKKLFFSSLGALAAGALCFPKETDEIFRDISYNVGKFAIAFYNDACGKNYAMRERIPCPEDLPPKPKPRPNREKNIDCDKKKK
ncbi:uncharacterized protein LOC142984604 [Anticarsia gemmatalis]|uniref:uncharacterized protein LOC142984604 n=1 Tax=Anticarsia gemmatalis TaxID=129554 RepID=UPI003F7741F5